MPESLVPMCLIVFTVSRLVHGARRWHLGRIVIHCRHSPAYYSLLKRGTETAALNCGRGEDVQGVLTLF